MNRSFHTSPPTDPSAVAQPTQRPLPAWAVATAMGVLHGLLCLVAFDPGAYIGGDNGSYVAIARGLLERGAYVDYWDPAMPAHTQYPPVFPLVLAGGMALGLSVWTGVKALCIVFSAAAVALSALWLRRELPPRPALAAALLVASTPATLALAAQVLSDVPFWTWTMLALWAYARHDEHPASRGWALLGAAAVVLAYFTRTAGLPLALAAAVWLIGRRRWHSLALLAGMLLPPAVLWAIRNRVMGGTSAYAREFWWINPYSPGLGTIGPVDLLLRVAENLQRYGTRHLPALFLGEVDRGLPALFLVLALTALAVGGWAIRLRRPALAELFIPLYVGLLLVWPATWGGERFLLPLLPALVGYAAVSLCALRARWPRARLLPPLAAAVLLVAMVPGVLVQARLGAYCRAEASAGEPAPCLPPVWAELLAVGSRVRGQLPEGSVVIHRKPSLFFVSSGYRSRLYPRSMDPDTFFAVVREAGAGYVVVDQVGDMTPYLHTVMFSRRHQFCVVQEFSSPNAVFTRIVPDAPPLPPDFNPEALRTCRVDGAPFPEQPPE